MTEPQWPLWSSEHPEADSCEPQVCPSCGQPVSAQAAFCEACGATVRPDLPPAAPQQASPNDASTQTRRLGTRASDVILCAACGGTIDSDGYCQVCGTKAPSPRDHGVARPADWVAGVCDRGVRHARNEDAMSLWAEQACAVLVVCDGVSSSTDADAAATAAAESVGAFLRDTVATLNANAADAALAQETLSDAFVAATQAANQAVIAITDPDSTNAASATLAVAVVREDQVYFANLGDSRIYLLGPTRQELLSQDDSMAQAFIAEGMSRTEAESLPRAHAITKWLGRDALDLEPRIGSVTVTEPSWVVVCSDGLWNYASEPAQLWARLAAADPNPDPLTLAEGLVTWANSQGGHDNITVALAQLRPLVRPSNVEPTDDDAHPKGEG